MPVFVATGTIVEFGRTDERWFLHQWYQPSSEQEDVQLTALFREASLEAIDRAMHHDIYLTKSPIIE
uniref:Uncharacterized protein n=1 Tax=Oryza sativa subsp. japonica TaxID=39947 RepID=Q5Z5K0_ORYSJ|nr:hypothetical protein [Oryza sativa Japonica Group]